MRLKTSVWVHGYLRLCNAKGASAVVVRHGDDDAGAVFIKVNRLDGSCDLYRPAPTGLDGAETERRWVALDAAARQEDAVDAELARECRFDSDLWVIEVEDRLGRHFLDGQLAVTERGPRS